MKLITVTMLKLMMMTMMMRGLTFFVGGPDDDHVAGSLLKLMKMTLKMVKMKMTMLMRPARS